MSKLAIYGDGGFGRELVPIARAALARHPEFSELVFVSDAPTISVHRAIPVLAASALEAGDAYILAIGSGPVREKLDAQCRTAGLVPFTLTAPTTVIGDAVEIGEGAVFCDFTMVTGSARIGHQFQCNIYSYVAHDCVIGDYVTFAPRVCCNGNVHIGDGAYIGTGAVIKQGTPDTPLTIGAGATVGMGAVVTKDVPEGAVVVGNPARVRE